MMTVFSEILPMCAIWKGFDRIEPWVIAGGAVVAVLVVFLIVRAVFRSHRCSAITVESPEGDTVISRQALSEAVERELGVFPELKLRRLRIFKYGGDYRIALNCEFQGTGSLPALAGKVRPRVKNSLSELFGVDTLSAVDIVVERFSSSEQ